MALLDLMNFSGDQIEMIPCNAFTIGGPTTFGNLRVSFNAATPLGVKIRQKVGAPSLAFRLIRAAPGPSHRSLCASSRSPPRRHSSARPLPSLSLRV